MSEMKAAMLMMIFFVAFLVPGILQFGIDSLNQNAFTKTTKEFTELVQEEAGPTAKIQAQQTFLQEKGYTITLLDKNGAQVTQTVPYGEAIAVRFDYHFKSVFKERNLQTTTTALVTKRDARVSENGTIVGKDTETGQGTSKPVRKIQLQTTESKDMAQTQTFTVTNLGKIKQLKTDTGKAKVVNVDGDTVTIQFDRGATSRQVQTSGQYVPGDAKYVTKQTHQVYQDNEGYVGTLNKYLLKGYLYQGQEKYVTGQFGKLYRDAENYTGELTPYLHSGELVAGGTKKVTAQTSEKYSDKEGYVGTLTRYLHSGAYQAAQSKEVTVSRVEKGYEKLDQADFNAELSYNEEGFMGTLSLKDVQHKTKKVQKTLEWVALADHERDLADNKTPKKTMMPTKESLEEYLGHPVLQYEFDGWRGEIQNKPRKDDKNVEYPYHRMYNLKYTFEEHTHTMNYAGTVTSPARDTRVYRYQGTVTKPASDTRIYRYQGVVKQPDIDMREWRYQGTVTRPEIDTRKFDKYYQYGVEITYEEKE